MNERIKELMDQAGIDVEAVENLGEMPTALKFAELIAAECINMIEAEADKLDAVWWSEQAEENAVHGMRNAAGLIGRAFITFN